MAFGNSAKKTQPRWHIQ